QEFERLEAAGLAEAAPYALCLGYRIRYVLDLNAREAMHLIELRSGREGHPAYRAVAQAMYERIAAVHPAIARAVIHVDSSRAPRPCSPPKAHTRPPPVRRSPPRATRRPHPRPRLQPASRSRSEPERPGRAATRPTGRTGTPGTASPPRPPSGPRR